MDILNKKERNSAFLLFLLMFVITTGVLIFALFFDFRLPLKENEVLKTENEKIIKEYNFNKVFTEKIEYVGKLIDTIEIKPQQYTYYEGKITRELSNLQKSADSIEGSRLYGNVIFNMKRLVESKKISTESNDSQGAIDKLTEKNETLKTENRQLGYDLTVCKSQSSSAN